MKLNIRGKRVQELHNTTGSLLIRLGKLAMKIFFFLVGGLRQHISGYKRITGKMVMSFHIKQAIRPDRYKTIMINFTWLCLNLLNCNHLCSTPSLWQVVSLSIYYNLTFRLSKQPRGNRGKLLSSFFENSFPSFFSRTYSGTRNHPSFHRLRFGDTKSYSAEMFFTESYFPFLNFDPIEKLRIHNWKSIYLF